MNDSPASSAKKTVLGTGKLPRSQGVGFPSIQRSQPANRPRRWILGGVLVAAGGLGLVVTVDEMLDLRHENSSLGGEVSLLKEARRDLGEQIDYLSGIRSQLVEKLNETEGQRDFLAEVRTSLTADLTETKAERDALTELATKLEEVNGLIKQDRDITRDKLVSSQTAAAELEKKLGQRENRISELQGIRDRLTEVNLDLKAELQGAIARAESLERENTGLQREIAALSSTGDELSDRIASLEAKLTEGQEETGSYAKQVTKLLDTVAEKDRELERLQNEISSIATSSENGPTAKVDSVLSSRLNLAP